MKLFCLEMLNIVTGENPFHVKVANNSEEAERLTRQEHEYDDKDIQCVSVFVLDDLMGPDNKVYNVKLILKEEKEINLVN